MGAVLRIGRQQGRHVDDLVHPVGVHRLQQVGDLGDVTPVHLDAVQVGVQVGARRRQVEAHHLFAPLHQLADDTVPDEAGAAGDHYGHGAASRGEDVPANGWGPPWFHMG